VKFRAIDSALDNGHWRREGIYFWRNPLPPLPDWEQTFKHFLAEGFLIPPNSDEPFILPFEMSGGEEQKLARALKI
jgi:hypothetical protein